MLARNDERLEIVLDVHELVHQFTLVVVIAHGDRSRHLVVAEPLLFNQIFADKIAYGLGPVFVVPALDMFVELVNKAFFEGDAETVESAHKKS
jgi:hypothetical protein